MSSAEASLPEVRTTAGKQLEDPLIAALPPNTDYITYLTILEYQLTPQNLSTLNRLLQEDDGKLATEIGWDLLKLVLPILRVEPAKAKECLDIIARRGNPREVIIRVAEELETLGNDDSGVEADPTEAPDGLPTFAGEAPRVHLGEMTLHGMPKGMDHETRINDPEHDPEHDENGPDAAVAELKLQALLTMLGLLHPRIKTQHPSRFLATSLPAALGAYRRLSMNTETTTAFLNSLTKLATKQRPALPPRVSTSNMLSTTSTNASTNANVVSAPLPDPESNAEKDTASQAVASNESAINLRLIHAVLLEIIDEHTTASSAPQPPLTARLRAHFEPHSITSARRSQLDTLTANEQAKNADNLRRNFVTAARDLKLDVSTALESHNKSLAEQPDAEEEDDEEPSEYPTSSSQIPFSATGLLLLQGAQQYLQSLSQHSTSNNPANLPISLLLESIDRQYETDFRLHHSPPAIDSILSLLYLTFCTPSPTTRTHTVESETLLLAVYNILQDIFTTCPDADLRDNAHHIASHLLHGHCQRGTRLKIIRGSLEAEATALSAVHEIQAGNLKAIAVDWLKDEIFPTGAVQSMMSRMDERDRGLPLGTVTDLAELLFPATQIGDDPGVDGDPALEQVVEKFASELPFYIAGLNLLCLVGKNHEDKELGTEATGSASASIPPATEASLDVMLVRGEVMLEKLEKWKDFLVGRLAKGKVAGTAEEREERVEVEGVSLSDVFALEDALGRAKEVLRLDA